VLRRSGLGGNRRGDGQPETRNSGSVGAKRNKELLHGYTACLFLLEEMAEKAGIAVGSFRWLYVLSSIQ
jgi:hypothetical protein